MGPTFFVKCFRREFVSLTNNIDDVETRYDSNYMSSIGKLFYELLNRLQTIHTASFNAEAKSQKRQVEEIMQ